MFAQTPEWVVKVCEYFLIGTTMALDVDAGCATVTSSRSKGKYGEHLQAKTQEETRQHEDVHDSVFLKLLVIHV